MILPPAHAYKFLISCINPPWHNLNEVSRSQLCQAIKYGCYHGGLNQRMCLCQEFQKSPAKTPLYLWEWPEHAWAWVHAVFEGVFEDNMFHLLINAHALKMDGSASCEARCIPTHDAKVENSFTAQGLPEMLVTDNGSLFTSAEFCDFMITHRGSMSCYHCPLPSIISWPGRVGC